MISMKSPITFVLADGRQSDGRSSGSTPPTPPKHEGDYRHRILLASRKSAERVQWLSFLSDKVFLVSCADNGMDALRAIEAGGFDLVIAAVLMPEVDGIELARAASTIEGVPPIIVVSRGHTALDHAYLRSAALAGATATYTQPLMANDFLAGVQSALTLKRSAWVKP